jgi:hypothetical protein
MSTNTTSTYKEPVIIKKGIRLPAVAIYRSNIVEPLKQDGVNGGEPRANFGLSVGFEKSNPQAKEFLDELDKAVASCLRFKAGAETFALANNDFPMKIAEETKAFQRNPAQVSHYLANFEPYFINLRRALNLGRPAHFVLEDGKPKPTVFPHEVDNGDKVVVLFDLLHLEAFGKSRLQFRLDGVLKLGGKTDPLPRLAAPKIGDMGEEEFEAYSRQMSSMPAAVDVSAFDLDGILGQEESF